MITDSEGIVIRQVKTVSGRRMILLFSKKYGKVGAGTGISEKGRSKSALALRPFTYGKYEIYKNRDSFHINGGEVLKSFYAIGEDVDKYMQSSYVMEFTDKLLPEHVPSPELFNLLLEFFSAMEVRKRKHETLVLAYMVKALSLSGSMPHLDSCVNCGRRGTFEHLSVESGGLLCGDCRFATNRNDRLIYHVNVGIINILRYFLTNPLRSLENLALDDEMQDRLQTVLKAYVRYHLDIGDLKSEGAFELARFAQVLKKEPAEGKEEGEERSPDNIE